MNSVEVDTARYHAELRDTDPDETVFCRCGQEVRPDEMKEIWNGKTFEMVCVDCSKEEE